MKIGIYLGTSLTILALAGQAFSQDDGRFRNDPTYSTHNYKHANKAATARRWEEKSGITVKQPASNDARLADYKKSLPNQEPAGGITIDHTPSTNLADRNYKIQRIAQPASSANENIAKRRKRNADSTAVIGN